MVLSLNAVQMTIAEMDALIQQQLPPLIIAQVDQLVRQFRKGAITEQDMMIKITEIAADCGPEQSILIGYYAKYHPKNCQNPGKITVFIK